MEPTTYCPKQLGLLGTLAPRLSGSTCQMRPPSHLLPFQLKGSQPKSVHSQENHNQQFFQAASDRYMTDSGGLCIHASLPSATHPKHSTARAAMQTPRTHTVLCLHVPLMLSTLLCTPTCLYNMCVHSSALQPADQSLKGSSTNQAYISQT